MNEFMMAAVPWICIGIAIALFAANHGAKKKAKEDGKEYGNYMTEAITRPLGCHPTSQGLSLLVAVVR